MRRADRSWSNWLSSHSKLRSEVVPKPPVDPTAHAPPAAEGDQLELPLEEGDKRSGRQRWAWVLRHVFAADLDTCPRCGGAMRWVEVATTDNAIARVLAEQGIQARAPPVRDVSTFGQLELGFG